LVYILFLMLKLVTDANGGGVNEKTAPPVEGVCKCMDNQQQQRKKAIPLIDYLCAHHKCTVKELHVLFQNLDIRRATVEQLRPLTIRTSHLRPAWKNFIVECNALSVHSANDAYAMRGYLGITVRTNLIRTCLLVHV
jgi:hypothetical protein